MPTLTPAARRELRAKAHALNPVVAIGNHGLTPAVLHEIDVALTAHELIKVRVFSDDRSERESILERISAQMDCAAVQHLGKVLVVWRPAPVDEAPPPARSASKSAAKKAPQARRPRTPLPRAPSRPSPAAPPAPRGKGRRGAARFATDESRGAAPDEAPIARKKSTYTPKTKPKSFSAKPNPRSAWEKKRPTFAAAKPASGARRRRVRS